MTCCSPDSKKTDGTCCASHATNGGCCWHKTRTWRVVLAGVFAAIIMYLFEGFWHGQYLMPVYELTESLWRPYEQMQQLWQISVGMTLALGISLSFIFAMNYENKGIGEGVRFGLPMGIIMGIIQSMAFLYLPISTNLATLWLLGWIVEGTLVGISLAVAFQALQKDQK